MFMTVRYTVYPTAKKRPICHQLFGWLYQQGIQPNIITLVWGNTIDVPYSTASKCVQPHAAKSQHLAHKSHLTPRLGTYFEWIHSSMTINWEILFNNHSHIYDNKLNIVGLWTVGWIKQYIWIPLYLLPFSDILLTKLLFNWGNIWFWFEFTFS